MKLKIASSDSWHGPVRVSFCPSGKACPELPKDVALPESAGAYVVVASAKADHPTCIVVSLGDAEKITLEIMRRAGGAVAGWMKANKASRAGVVLPKVGAETQEDVLYALAEGLLLGSFRFDRHRSNRERVAEPSVDVLVERAAPTLTQVLRKAAQICSGTMLARELAHEPPNVINPKTLASRAQAVARKANLKCTVLDHRRLAQMKAGGIIGVGQGSATPPCMIVMEYAGLGRQAAKPVVLIGKAITFDTGGYSIKSKDGILGMKYDKCGGMAVIGAMQAIAALKPKTPVVGIIAAAENMISGEAYRPDDIITTLSGKTVQIVSADAEGRMVLCDALTYAQKKYKPRCMIDMATLTGGVTVALGTEAAGIFCNNDSLQAALIDSGKRVHERLWPLPLWDEYFELIKGDDSDFKNSGGREAHASVGAIFLRQFVDEKTPWAHLDIAGVADVNKDKPYCPKGATGFGVRLVMDYILGL